ncbi:MAG: YvrJ family protein [Anaerococcus prevotii]|nr:YvrJ family protein [Anaerococcus prevotii]MDU3137238.1 YvrJ family protein [Anaerococcus prevotii]
MDIIKIISELGFPVAICIILIFQINGKIDRILIDINEIKNGVVAKL